MSCAVELNKLSQEQEEKIGEDLELKMEKKGGYGSKKNTYVYPYHIDDKNILHLPFAYGYKTLKKQRPPRSSFPKADLKFVGKLRENQKEIKKEAVDILSKKGSIIISCYTGYGKTITGINIASGIKFKTLVVVKLVNLMKQWEKNIKAFCPSNTVQQIKPGCKKIDADFYIINATNMHKFGADYFSDIGTVIVDEAHLIMAEKLSVCMQHVHPRYLIALTATPYRPDGLNILLELYFGSYKIYRKLYRKHTIYKVKTGFVPTIELTNSGTVNWNIVLDSQAYDEKRNDIIIDIVQKFKERNIMILTKRIAQATYLLETLSEKGEYATSMIGKEQDFDEEARILIGTVGKIGVGFDHSKLDALILGADLQEYFIQYLGRVFRTPGCRTNNF